jgi:low temperature requirement protein LtrA
VRRLITGRSRTVPARDPDEPHRVATPLELFFDLVFVVAIGQAALSLEHAVAEDHVGDGIVSYLFLFFAIWWAWINWTWPSSAFDTGDVFFRLTSFAQTFGVLVLAAGISQGFAGDLVVPVIGYVIMRLSQVALWVRVALRNTTMRTTAVRYAVGVTIIQLCWIGLLAFPSSLFRIGFVVFALGELLVPIWAERAQPTPWHPHHIAERYLLFTIIVLGETVLASVLAVKAAISGLPAPDLVLISVSGFAIVCSMWWLYTQRSAHHFLTRGNRVAFPWGYGHFIVFASAAAVGAGIATLVAFRAGTAHISQTVAVASVAIPVSAFVLSVWFVHLRPHRDNRAYAASYLVTSILVLLTPLIPLALPVIALLMVGCVVASELSGRPANSGAAHP